MTLDQYIQQLEQLRKETGGNVQVTLFAAHLMGVSPIPSPTIKYTRKKRPREQKTYYWEAFDKEDEKLERVIKIY